MNRSELANKLIEARTKTCRFTHMKPKTLFNELDAFEIDESYSSLFLKAAIIVLGYKPTCKECGKPVDFYGVNPRVSNVTIFGGWKSFCSKTCLEQSDIPTNKRKQTNLIKYGAEN